MPCAFPDKAHGFFVVIIRRITTRIFSSAGGSALDILPPRLFLTF